MENPTQDQEAGQKIRLLSFNVQAGTSTARYHHYLTHSWRHVLPHTQRVENLDAIADLVSPYDMVALQEVDSGSLRSGFINQSRYLATQAGMPFWCHQSNRKVGTVAYAGNGFLSRFEPSSVEEHRLPGAIPGRGSLLIRYGQGDHSLLIAVVHLALGKRARGQQIRYLTSQLEGNGNLVVMGDFNSAAGSPEIRSFREALGLAAPTEGMASYPSWQPQRAIDHILISDRFRTRNVGVIDVALSDHCPVEVEVGLPDDLHLDLATRPVIAVQSRGPTARSS